MTSKNSDGGVSPVIGVILMVSVTVILAAVIGTFMLGLGSEVEETKHDKVSDSVEMRIDSEGVHVYRMGLANEIVVEEYRPDHGFLSYQVDVIETVKFDEEGTYSWSSEKLNKFSRREGVYYRAYAKSNESERPFYLNDRYSYE